jgi:phosphatidylserine/phosphatidylglycerophosphate/cardiolipin synthase-like enzyme
MGLNLSSGFLFGRLMMFCFCIGLVAPALAMNAKSITQVFAQSERVPGAACGASPSCTEPQFTLIADQAYEEALAQTLTRAKRQIDLVHFEFFTEKGFVKSIADRLVELKQKNPALKIRVLLEGDHEGVAERNMKTRDKLTKAGVEVQMDSAERMTHTKLVLVDQRWALFGSHNLTNNSLERNNETSILFASSTLGSELSGYLDRLFADPSRNRAEVFTDGPLTLLTDDAYYEQALRLVRESRSSVDLAMYFVAYRSEADVAVKTLLEDLVSAHKRGVRVRLFLEQSNRFAPQVTEANRKAVQFLKDKGVRDIVFDRPDKISHAKYLIVDGARSLLGSTNWYSKDLDSNHQVNALIEDADFSAGLTTLFDSKVRNEGVTVP